MSCCSAARFIASLISSLVVAFLATNLRSITETFGVGTRMATPSSLPLSSGSTRPIALAAPVEVGIIDSAAARAAVEILVHGVERRLVAGIGVDRGHEAVLDADRVVEHLGDRREAVGGAGGVGDDLVVLGQLVVVDAVDDGEVGAVGRRRDQHALGAGGQMRRGLVLGGEDAGAFERDVDAEVLPRQLRRDRARR